MAKHGKDYEPKHAADKQARPSTYEGRHNVPDPVVRSPAEQAEYIRQIREGK